MHILCPVNKPEEVDPVVAAGATELYCGVLPDDWKRRYTNMASPNRREWAVSNLQGFAQLEALVKRAHSHGVPVYLTMNALYTERQYPDVKAQVERVTEIGVDALIVADLGLILSLREWGCEPEIHISTGGTTFNSETARFYQSLGANRVVLPRHFAIDEAVRIAQSNPSITFEMFILNRGCKNIDGFCTFHHGVNEVRLGNVWNIPKKLNMDQHFLSVLQRLPRSLGQKLAEANVYGSVGACFLNYDVEVEADDAVGPESRRRAAKTISSSFNLLTGIDTCGGCALYQLARGGIRHLKIVGRGNLTPKKVRDVTFLKKVLRQVSAPDLTKDEFRRMVKSRYRDVYGVECRGNCYYF